MGQEARHDAWAAGENYDLYMGRWSRRIAPRFLDWLGVPAGQAWLEIGCGTGVLSAAIVERCAPGSLLAIDPSEGFLARAREMVADARAAFYPGDARDLPAADAGFDAVVSALVLNFVPDRERALAEMRRVLRPGGMMGFYVWDYPGGGIELMHAFWRAATELNPAAEEFAEGRRFPFCTPDALQDLVRQGGFVEIEHALIEEPTQFRDFDDYWRPFTLGAGPAPGYCAALQPESRERLRSRLEASLPRGDDGSIPLTARAWAVKARAPRAG